MQMNSSFTIVFFGKSLKLKEFIKVVNTFNTLTIQGLLFDLDQVQCFVLVPLSTPGLTRDLYGNLSLGCSIYCSHVLEEISLGQAILNQGIVS